jgi:3-deoxy-D-manno-octulosonic-acid transferase
MYLLTPYLLLRLWWKGRYLPAYRRRWSERFCLNQPLLKTADVWVHAVSLGEVIAVTPLVEAMLNKGWSVLITTMTPTGSERVTTRFGERVLHHYAPYDLPLVLKRFFKRTKPRLGIIVETELWPNLIYQAQKASVPLLLINARLSQRSLRGYLRFKFFFKRVLNQFTAILTQSEEDAMRFIALGAKPDLVQALGNMKFDLQTHTTDCKPFHQLKTGWGKERVVFIAASTHEGEESQILAQFRRLERVIPNIILLIAPRHPERFQAVYQLGVEAGFVTGLRSKPDKVSSETQVLVLDSLGELLGFFEVSDYAFVGGSLVPVGGHNVLEPIAVGVPVLSGQHVFNFATICRDLKEVDAILLVKNAEELVNAVIQLHEDNTTKQRMVANARLVLERNKGALERYLQRMDSLLK